MRESYEEMNAREFPEDVLVPWREAAQALLGDAWRAGCRARLTWLEDRPRLTLSTSHALPSGSWVYVELVGEDRAELLKLALGFKGPGGGS